MNLEPNRTIFNLNIYTYFKKNSKTELYAVRFGSHIKFLKFSLQFWFDNKTKLNRTVPPLTPTLLESYTSQISTVLFFWVHVIAFKISVSFYQKYFNCVIFVSTLLRVMVGVFWSGILFVFSPQATSSVCLF